MPTTSSQWPFNTYIHTNYKKQKPTNCNSKIPPSYKQHPPASGCYVFRPIRKKVGEAVAQHVNTFDAKHQLTKSDFVNQTSLEAGYEQGKHYDVICNTDIYTDDMTLYSKCDLAYEMWQQLADLQDTVDWGRKWLVDFNAGKTQLISLDRSKNTGAIDVKKDESVLEEKSSFKMLGLTFSFKLDWGSYTVSIAKTASKKIGVLIRSMKFLSPEVALYLYKSTIWSCMEYCCHVWTDAPSCYLVLLDKLQK